MVIVIGSIIQDQAKSDYEITRFIGSGSFGNVYEARRKSDATLWAVKTLQTPFADEISLKSFVNEGNLATAISHRNVIKYTFFHDGTIYPSFPPYIIMEFAEGGTLAQLIQSRQSVRQPFTNDELKLFFTQLIDGMEAINASLVHRDIKPDNILLSLDTVKISDFGLSKIVTEATRTTTFKGIGCIPYMAPEAWRFEKNTILMDIYSMGIVFYELATLSHPLTVSKGDITDWQNVHFFQNPPRPDTVNRSLTSVVSQTITKMMEKKPESRFQNWSDVRNLLARDQIPSVTQSALVDAVLKKRMEIDEKQKIKQLETEKRNQEIEQLNRTISYQFDNDIVQPIRTFLDQINVKYAGPKNVIQISRNGMSASLTTSSHKQLNLEVRPILWEDFYRERITNDYGMQHRTVELRLPTYRGQPLLAWGHLKASDKRGFNLILLENKDSPYGIWQLLVNRCNPIAKVQRVEPFPFDFNEIEKEIQLVSVMHIYVTEGRGLDIDFICNFVAEYI